MKLLPLFFGLSAGLVASLSYAQSPTSTDALSITSGDVLNLRFDSSRIGESGTLANNPAVSYYFGNGTLLITSDQGLVLNDINLSVLGLPAGNYSPTSLNTPAAGTLSIGGYTDPWAQSAASAAVLLPNSQGGLVQPTSFVLLNDPSTNGNLQFVAAPVPAPSTYLLMLFAVPLIVLLANKGTMKKLSARMNLDASGDYCA